MNLRQIEAFRAVMTTGSITQAAERLRISQPATSRLIGDLEKNLAITLFVREHRRVVATEEARLLYQEVQRAYVGLDAIQKAADAIRTFRVGSLKIVTMPVLASHFLPDVIAGFNRACPDVNIWLEVQQQRDVAQWVASRQYDLGIAILPISDPAVSVHPFCTTEAWCILPAQHDLATKREIKADDLRQQPFISLGQDSMFRHIVDETFENKGIERLQTVESRTAESVFSLVAAGVGVSLIGPIIPPSIHDPRITLVPFRPRIQLRLAILYPKHQPASQICQRFAALVIDFAKQSTDRTPTGTRK